MKEKNKKIFNRILSILSSMLFVLAMLTFIYVLICKINNKTPQIFGYSFHFVVTPSMEPDIKVGDFVIGKSITIRQLYENNKDKIEEDKDVILFVSPNPSDDGIIIVHKIRDIVETENGYSIYTYGINNSSDDPYPTDSVIGEVVFVSSLFGKIFNPLNAIFILIIFIIAVFFYFAVKAFIKNYRGMKTEELIGCDSSNVITSDEDEKNILEQDDTKDNKKK